MILSKNGSPKVGIKLFKKLSKLDCIESWIYKLINLSCSWFSDDIILLNDSHIGLNTFIPEFVKSKGQ